MAADPRAIADWLISEALKESELRGLFDGLCRRLDEDSVPLVRAHVAMRTLHPMFEAVDFTWLRDRGVLATQHVHRSEEPARWQQSPLRWMLENELEVLRLRLETPDERFPVLEEFRDLGGTEYLALMTPFGEPETAYRRADGIIASWVTDREGGFGENDIDILNEMQLHLALVAKLWQREQTALNVVSAYMGSDVGRRVLEGQIRRGDVDQIPAVIWYSDLRDSTAMAERASPSEFLKDLNTYFECAAGAVLDHGGEVLRFVGDAVLAVFPISGVDGATRSARMALAASRDANARLDEINSNRAREGLASLRFGLGLHVGELLYGNIGVPTRVEFSVVGTAANEVARLEDLTKIVGERVVVSRAFSEALPLEWRPLGQHSLKGVGEPQDVFAPPAS